MGGNEALRSVNKKFSGEYSSAAIVLNAIINITTYFYDLQHVTGKTVIYIRQICPVTKSKFLFRDNWKANVASISN